MVAVFDKTVEVALAIGKNDRNGRVVRPETLVDIHSEVRENRAHRPDDAPGDGILGVTVRV
jgi:hypothetical protein